MLAMHFMCHIGYNGRDDIENDYKNLGDKIKAQKKKKKKVGLQWKLHQNEETKHVFLLFFIGFQK